ncbi:flagellin [Xanthomonas phaseoli pv. phaseoli]|uniref:Flagellin n=9 Tax=Xanthomonas TaxID=338 RepID=A0AAI7ZF86_XANAC|nr:MULTISPECIES: flagellin [Xanthomonas]MBV6781658.1 flagellin [Xanthomonas campestris pv. trichodesmae]OOW53120.1 flagellin [Xanthomonas campestris pv. centellae]OOW63483.1 flagellin [Xanthomonas campestris pv. thespesiae]OOW80762.1 flagellin [Xanthomonas campestris pv. leeana]OOW83927.1 flagellin [Xanthomonas campestris pv. vitiswoodrowii]OOW97014.1 flagellin [Xanthomonas campestris pv. vitiscarnosae]OOX15492.1 flagellin [Xanthomonas campestris pv. azadirachtae]CEJ43499.1 A-type flagellin
MAQVINTNVMSLNAQRNLNTSSASMSTSIQRLSSGLRINSAKDDAAGLAISERFTTQIRGLDVASRNANDGISLAQTAEGAMVEIGNNLQRIRELSVQSSNATNSATDREALNSEVKQLTSEIDRVANQTNFNGTKLLDGSFSGALFQVGADAGQTIGINSIVDANVDSLGKANFAAAVSGAGVTGTATASGSITGISLAFNDASGTAKTVTIGDVKIANGDDAATINKKVASAINDKLDQTGMYASIDTSGNLKLESLKAGQDFTSLTMGTSSATGVTVGAGLQTASAASGSTAVTLTDLDISTFAGSQQALEIVDKALTAVNSSRADMGAVQNRFTSTIANLSATSENLSASRSRIRDTDYAKETAELTRTQILQQAGTAMLAQAKSVPQNVLSLLQ